MNRHGKQGVFGARAKSQLKGMNSMLEDEPADAALTAKDSAPTKAHEESIDVPDEVREAIINDFLEEAAFEEFKQARPDLWMQVKRLNKVLDLQDDSEDQCFQSGTCFIHTNTPDYQGFCVKRVIEIDLESCMVVIEIYGEDELRPGVVMLPLETIAWFGFPTEKVAMDVHFRGFTFGQKSTPSHKPVTARIGRNHDEAGASPHV